MASQLMVLSVIPLGTRCYTQSIRGQTVMQSAFSVLGSRQKDWALGNSTYFDDELLTKVRIFQSSVGLSNDGIVGKDTWRNLA